MVCVFIMIGAIFGAAATWFLLTSKYSYKKITLALQKLEGKSKEFEEFTFKATREIAYLKERVNVFAEVLKQRT